MSLFNQGKGYKVDNSYESESDFYRRNGPLGGGNDLYNPPAGEKKRKGTRISYEDTRKLFNTRMKQGSRNAFRGFVKDMGKQDEYYLVDIFEWLGI